MNIPSKLIKFVDACLGVVCKSVSEYSSKFSRRDFTLRQHIVMLCLKIKMKQKYREFCDLLGLMPHIQEILCLKKVPHWTTLDKVFLRLKNHVLSALLQVESSGFASIDATGFDRRHASKQYLNRCKIHIKSLKATFLVDTVKQEILDIHSTTTRKHDSKIVLPLTQKHRLRVLCGDMGYDDRKVRRALQMRGTRPLIPYRQFMKKHKYWNSLMDKKLYHKRSLSETVNSVIKRRYSDTLYSKNWRSQFKEMTLLAVVYNIDRRLKDFLEGFYEAKTLNIVMLLRKITARLVIFFLVFMDLSIIKK